MEYKKIVNALLRPNEVVDSVGDIDLGNLYNRGYKTVLLDVDNTLMTYQQKRMTIQMESWVQKVKSIGFKVFLFSNNLSKRRIRKACEQVQVPGIYFALKPFSSSLRELSMVYDFDLKTSIVVGDQLLKDVTVGNWVDAYTILVPPLAKQLSFAKATQRQFELKLLNFVGWKKN